MRMQRERFAPFAATLVVVAIVTMSAPVAVDAALVANWTMDDAVGSTAAVDSAGTYDASMTYMANDSTGEVTFGLAGANGNTGTAAEFHNDGAFLQVGYDAALNPATFTVALWAKNAWGSATNKGILESWDPSGGYFMKQDWTTGWAFFSRSSDTKNILGTNSVANTPLTTDWTHVAITYDGTTKSIYLDGLLANDTDISLTQNTSHQLVIGQMGNLLGSSQSFIGLIDDIGLWDTALSQAEIQAVMANGVLGEVAAVPEPSTFILAGFGLLGLGLVGRRKRRR